MCVRTHRVNLDEGFVLLFAGRKAQHVVQQHGISVIEVRLRDKGWRICEHRNTVTPTLQAAHYVTLSHILTVAAAANIQETGLSTGTETLVGGVLGPIGKHGFGCNKPVQRNSLKLPLTLINELQRSGNGKKRVRLQRVEGNRNVKVSESPAGVRAVEG